MTALKEEIAITWEMIRPRTWKERLRRQKDKDRDVWRVCTTRSGYLYKSGWVNHRVAMSLARSWCGWIEYAPTIDTTIEEVQLTPEDLASERKASMSSVGR